MSLTNLERARRFRERHRDRISEKQRIWRAANREQVNQQARKYREIHKIKLARRRRERYRHRAEKDRQNRIRRNILLTNPNFRIRLYLSNRFRQAIRKSGGLKINRMIKLIGCSIEDFWIYLESKFEPGMTRENYGKVWHIDHIMPCAIFDLTKPEHQKRCFHFSNLQPLFAEDNRRKSDKIVTNQFQLL